MRYALAPKTTIFYILLISVLMDIAFGALDYFGWGFIRLSLLFRVTILLAFFVVVIRNNDIEAWFVKLLLLLWLVSLSVSVVVQGKLPLVLDITFFLKTLYPMCITFLVANALQQAYLAGEDIEELVLSGVILYGVIASFSILFSLITGIGRNTYGEWGFGIKSFFTGGNDIGLTMLISLIFAWVFMWRKDGVIDASKVLLLTFCIPLIGSRTSWGGGAGVTAIFAFAFLFFRQANATTISVFKLLIISVGLILTVYSAKFIDENFDAIAHNVDQVSKLMEGVNPRDILKDAGYEVLSSRPVILDVFGQGTTFFYEVYDHYFLGRRLPTIEGAADYKAIEQDLLDLYGLYGILLGGAFLLYHFYYWFVALKTYLRDKNILHFGFLFALSLFVFHGLMAGHAFSSPQVGTVVGSIYGLFRFKAWQRRQGVVV